MTDLNENLVADLARLAIRYPAEDWERLADYLSNDEWRERVRQLLHELAIAGGERGKRAKNAPGVNRTKRLKESIARLRQTDLARADEIERLWEKLRARELLPTMPSVRTFAAAIGLKGLESKKREGAVVELLQHLVSMPSEQLERLMRETVVEERRLGDEYERWVQLIMGDRDAGSTRAVVTATASPRHFVLVHDLGRAVDTGRTQNIGYAQEHVLAALERLDGEGHTHEVLDASTLSDDRRAALESDVRGAFMYPHQKTGRRIGNSFGTNQYPWQDFGTGIPVLLVYEGTRCVDVYPHQEINGTVTIATYLAPVM